MEVDSINPAQTVITKVVVEQLDSEGNVYRTFTRYTENVPSTLFVIRRAFNMDHTRVTVAGEVVS